MTPAERIAQLRLLPSSYGHVDLNARLFFALLALAEAVPARLADGHRDEALPCADYWNRPCDCGHDALAAAWAALGDE